LTEKIKSAIINYQNLIEVDIMQTMKTLSGKLTINISSEGNYIKKDTEVIVKVIVDNFRNIFVLVQSAFNQVRLPYYDTDVEDLVR
jgi:hypothetical protein